MKQIADRYKGKKTPKGHELRVEWVDAEATISYIVGAPDGTDTHLGIAHVGREGDGWVVRFESRPHETQRYSNREGLYAALDEEIATR